MMMKPQPRTKKHHKLLSYSLVQESSLDISTKMTSGSELVMENNQMAKSILRTNSLVMLRNKRQYSQETTSRGLLALAIQLLQSKVLNQCSME